MHTPVPPDGPRLLQDFLAALAHAGIERFTTRPGAAWWDEEISVSGLFEALDIEDLPAVQALLPVLPLRACQPQDGRTRLTVSCGFVVGVLAHVARLPAAAAWWAWLSEDYLPVLAQTGHYDPATEHRPPPAQADAAMFLREIVRELFSPRPGPPPEGVVLTPEAFQRRSDAPAPEASGEGLPESTEPHEDDPW